MKLFRKISVPPMLVVLGIVLAMTFSNCSKQISPLGPQSIVEEEKSSLEFISLNDLGNTLQKSTPLSATGYVSRRRGGELAVRYGDFNDGNSGFSVYTSFKVLPHTINESALLKLQLDESLLSGDVGVEFTPHGIVFSSPALLNIEVRNADLSQIDPERLGLYYTSTESGEWEKMTVEEIIIDQENGYLKVVNAQIPHFSRYALAHSE